MIKYVKKEYEVLEGTIEHEEPKPAIHRGYVPSTSPIIALPNRSTGHLLPPAQDRYKIIRESRAQGIDIGAKVIRVYHIKEAYIDCADMIGTVQSFLFTMYPGQTQYLPILVRFPVGASGYQDLPFALEEIETLENAKEQLKIKSREKAIISLQEGVISDLLKERNGVVPFRTNVIHLPTQYRGD